MILVNTEREPKELLKDYQSFFQKGMDAFTSTQSENAIYDPVKYILSLGGKRLRPILALAACESLGGNVEDALPAAMAVEIFHNFTLMHDDIMDDAPLRRGKTTVHEKWDDNTAILSGDAMLVQAYDELCKSKVEYLPALLQVFNRTALEVCEGQQFDMEFETRDDVKLEEYMEMIRLKTSVLLAGALKMGAIAAGADTATQDKFYQYGIDTGLAFQLQDDFLDAFGDPASFGKQVGGDILADKKTFLYITATEKGSAQDQQVMQDWVGKNDRPEEKVDTIKTLFQSTGAADALRGELKVHHDRALETLGQIPVNESGHALFSFLTEMVTIREV